MRAYLGAGAVALLGVIAVEGCGQQAPAPEVLDKTQQAISTGLVIAAISGGSGTYKADYVEIFNRGPAPIALAGITLQYSRSDYRTWSNAGNTISLTGTIPAGRYYLVKLNPNTTGTNELPTPDFTQATPFTNYATGGALVALVTGTTPLDCGPPNPITVDGGMTVDPDGGTATPCTSATIIDFVGYGGAGATPAPAPVYEGTAAAPSHDNTSVLRRKDNGCQDTDQNGNDFEKVAYGATVVPRNSATAANVCAAVDAGVDAAVDVAVDAVVDAPVDVPVDAADGSSDAKTDAKTDGAADGGTDTGPSTDTGTVEDTGTPSTDTGTPTPTDTGSAAVDTGTPAVDEVTDDSGCGCRVAGEQRTSIGASLIGMFFALGAIARRRRK